MKHINIHTVYSYLIECIILLCRFMVIAPGLVPWAGDALMSLATLENVLYSHKILFCSPYRHIFWNASRDIFSTTREEEAMVQQALKEALWRACCPSRRAVRFRSRESIQHFAEAPMVSPFLYFCHYSPIEEASNDGARGPQPLML